MGADFSLVDDSDTKFVDLFSLDKVVHPIDRSLDPKFPTILTEKPDDTPGSPEAKAAITQPARRKRGGKKKHF